MKAIIAVAMTTVMVLGVGVATADEHGPPPEHPHALVLGLEVDENDDPVAARKCVDLATNRSLKLIAQHAHLHTGRAGEAQWQAGNAVVPLAPLTPWANCAELMAAFGL